MTRTHVLMVCTVDGSCGPRGISSFPYSTYMSPGLSFSSRLVSATASLVVISTCMVVKLQSRWFSDNC